jgi:hypothetical protein
LATTPKIDRSPSASQYEPFIIPFYIFVVNTMRVAPFCYLTEIGTAKSPKRASVAHRDIAGPPKRSSLETR